MNEVTVTNTVTPLRARDYTPAQLQLMKRTVAADCDDSEFNLFMEVARRVGLDPFRRQIYAVVYNKKKADKRKMSIITGIDGFRAVAARNGDYRPDENEAEIVYDKAMANPQSNPLGIVKAVVRCFKYGPDKEWHQLTGVAYWDEFAPLQEKKNKVDTGEKWPDGNPKFDQVGTGEFTLPQDSKWRSMARVMIAKCAEAQAIRKGWPEDLSGIYAPEEMERANVIDGTATEIVEEHLKEERLKLVNAKDSIAIWWRAGEALEMVPLGKVFDACCKFVRACDTDTEIRNWLRTNEVSLKEFWARSKADALELKKQIEARIKAVEPKE
jgi:phage recombination protein Bet